MYVNRVENTAFLKQFIDSQGNFNYDSLDKNSEWLEHHLKRIECVDVDLLNPKQAFVLYLNAYNVFVLKGVMIELQKNPQWNGNKGLIQRFKFFVLRKFIIGKRKISLYNLEHKIRKNFKDPRIHFAINCASASCPVLPGKLFDEDSVDDYLDFLARKFINSDAHVKIDNDKQTIIINPIFKWYKKDFEPEGTEGIKKFIKRYKNGIEKLNLEHFKLKYLDYDWTLNKQ